MIHFRYPVHMNARVTNPDYAVYNCTSFVELALALDRLAGIWGQCHAYDGK
jgi:hypothetical protein